MTPDQIKTFVENHHQRLNDHEKRIKIQEEIYREVIQYVKELRDESKKTNEILQAWGDAKGFVRVVSTVGKVILWIGAIAGAIAFFIKSGGIK